MVTLLSGYTRYHCADSLSLADSWALKTFAYRYAQHWIMEYLVDMWQKNLSLAHITKWDRTQAAVVIFISQDT